MEIIRVIKKIGHIICDPLIIFQKRIEIAFNVIRCMKKLDRDKRSNKKIKVLFLLQYPEMWNSVKTIYESLRLNDKFEVCILAIPKRVGVYSRDIKFHSENEAYEFCLKNNMDAIKAYNGSSWHPIELIQPRYIFLQRPYDQFMPDCYKMRPLSRKALLCYVPYSGRLTKGIHMEIEFNSNLLNYCYAIFADCNDSYTYIREKIARQIQLGIKKVYNVGFPRFDLLHKCAAKECTKPTSYLWTPRWSASKDNDMGHFLDYYTGIMDFFQKHNDLNLVIRPHPLMFTNYIDLGIVTQKEVDNIFKTVASVPNIKFDDNIDYLKSFDECDVLISDSTSLLLEFFMTGKAIVRCFSMQDYPPHLEDLTEDALVMYKQFYIIKDEKDLINVISMLAEGQDPLGNERQKQANRMSRKGVTTGEVIAGLL